MFGVPRQSFSMEVLEAAGGTAMAGIYSHDAVREIVTSSRLKLDVAPENPWVK